MSAPLAVDGPGAPPRDNGELVFSAPWESRAFGMAVSLHDSGAFTWDRFQAALIERIAAWEVAHPSGEGWSYYRCWLDALEDVLAGDGTVFADEITSRAHQLSHRAPGHDHPHPHPHPH